MLHTPLMPTILNSQSAKFSLFRLKVSHTTIEIQSICRPPSLLDGKAGFPKITFPLPHVQVKGTEQRRYGDFSQTVDLVILVGNDSTRPSSTRWSISRWMMPRASRAESPVRDFHHAAIVHSPGPPERGHSALGVSSS
ncbi:hypothetical protein IE53DRAFT_227461 [Violaceomyces palustris]|uniref:Uncharacterized protein n=1 Tax=Violaceomyces palustris TaxID=1673888 RepID=A0ACD0NPS7_9BASI|nr:hypothetical protein IE53DRAFT_227461 [Violaceomyces palustris]